MLDLFDTRVNGLVASTLQLRGKPAPDTFLEAARVLGVSPARAVVVEDAIAGVEAGRAGGFGLVLLGAASHLFEATTLARGSVGIDPSAPRTREDLSCCFEGLREGAFRRWRKVAETTRAHERSDELEICRIENGSGTDIPTVKESDSDSDETRGEHTLCYLTIA